MTIDRSLFHFINVELSNPILDLVLPYCREMAFWMPVYVFILVQLVLHYKRKAWIAIIGVILTVTLSDTISSKIVKPYFHRLRPCRSELQVIQRVPCGVGYSFTSSHAANHFALACIWGLLMGPLTLGFGLAWASLVSFAQIYVGVHYPLDITGGALLGIGIALFVYFVLLKYFHISRT